MKKNIKLIILFLVFSLVLVGCAPKKDSELVLQQKEIYQLAQNVGFSGTFEEWLDSIKGEQGIPGDSIELSVSDGYIKWKNKAESQWYNLVPLIDLVGTNGTDGKEVTFQVSDGYIKWQYVGETTWTNLVELSTLVGTKGNDGKEVTFQVSDGYIQWQYVGDATWTNLVELSTLVGPKGNDGKDGKSAYEVYIETHPNYTGDEQQWLDDLVNGRLGNKEFHIVVFDSNEGTEIESQEVENGHKAAKPEDPIKEGYTFDGWYINENEKWVFGGYNVTEDITLVAKWKANEYKVTFDAGIGTVEPSEVYYTYNEEVELPIPVLEDNYFMGWYNGDELVEDGLWKIASDIELTAYFIQEKYNVYYDFGYDDLEDTELASYGQAYSPITPRREEYVFNGWFDEDGNLYDGDEQWDREEDLYLTAFWIPYQQTITLDLNGGSLEGKLTFDVTYGEDYILPVPTSSEGPFNGWYLDEVKMTNKLGVSLKPYEEIEDVTLIAIYFIEVSTAEDLVNIKDDLEANYRLVNDIDISEVEWIPLGDNVTPFTGILDGQDFTINGLTITQPHDYVGLFGYSSGEIKNLKLDNVNINFSGNLYQVIYGASLVGYNTGLVENIETLAGIVTFRIRSGVAGYIGGIVGYNNAFSTFTNLQNNLDVAGDLTNYTGGLVGYSYSSYSITIISSYNTGEVSGSNNVGGLVGYSSSSFLRITDSYNTGEVRGSGNNVGGLVGYSLDLLITDSYNGGAIIGNNEVGGLVGYSNYFSINSSYNTGGVSGNSHVGGLVGYYYNYSSSSIYYFLWITDSYNDGAISGSTVGGLVGYYSNSNSSLTITDSYNAGAISGSSRAGGLVGYSSSSLAITDSYNAGTISGSSRAGGLVGYSSSFLKITDSYNTGEVNGSEYGVGGLVGYSSSSKITLSYNAGAISGSSGVGGLVGHSNSSSTITDSYNVGAISGDSKVGGLVGHSNSVTITSSYNTGKVNGSEGGIGGLAGDSSSSTITDSYNIGAISGSSSVGGLVGDCDYDDNSVTITFSFNTGKVSGSDYVGGLVGLSNKVYLYYSVNLGEVRVTGTTTNIGGIQGNIPDVYDEEHVYHIGEVYVIDTKVEGLEYGTKVNDTSIFTEEFLVETMGWEEESIVLISVLEYIDSLLS